MPLLYKNIRKNILVICIALYGYYNHAAVLQLSSYTNTLCIKASTDYLTLHWQDVQGKRVMVVASLKPDVIVLQTETKYWANAKFGQGQKINNGFVVYNGHETSVKISGLIPEVNYYISIFESDASDNFINNSVQRIYCKDGVSGTIDKAGPLSPLTVYTVVCPAIAGVTTSLTGTTNSGTSTASAAGCPHVGYADPGAMNPWTSAAGTGTIQWQFSAPVKASTLRMNSVNTNDYGTISASGGTGGPITLSGLVCMGVAGLVVGPLSVAGYGGVYFIPTSTGSYTNITLLNTGAQSGFVGACPTAITTAPLPIEILNFDGICKNGAVEFKWKTISERNNDYFTIERSKDGINWQTVTVIKGAGTSNIINNYESKDTKTFKGVNYYRLKQTDFDGGYKYIPMINVENCGSEVKGVSIYPNPAGNEVNILTEDEVSVAEIYNISGIVLVIQQLQYGINNIDLSNILNGVYFIKITSPKLESKSFKLIVQK